MSDTVYVYLITSLFFALSVYLAVHKRWFAWCVLIGSVFISFFALRHIPGFNYIKLLNSVLWCSLIAFRK